MQLIDEFKDFISRLVGGTKHYFRGRTQFLGMTGPIWIDTENPEKLYNEIAELSIPIDKGATLFMNGEVRMRRSDDHNTTQPLTPELMQLFKQPNPLETFNDYLFNYWRKRFINGHYFIYKNQTDQREGKMPATIMNVSAKYVKPVLTGKYYSATTMADIVSGYEIEDGKRMKFTALPDDMIWGRIPDVNDPLGALSPIKGLRHQLSNIVAAYKFYNVISEEKGAIGMISPDSKDVFGAIPINPNIKKEISQEHTKNYGIKDGQAKILIQDTPSKFTAFGYPTNQLELQQQIDKNFEKILSKFGLSINLFTSSTYENLRTALISAYNDVIIPVADSWGQEHTTLLKNSSPELQNGWEIFLDYSYLTILKDDETVDINNMKTKIDSIVQLKNNNLINEKQAVAIINQLTNIEIPKSEINS